MASIGCYIPKLTTINVLRDLFVNSDGEIQLENFVRINVNRRRFKYVISMGYCFDCVFVDEPQVVISHMSSLRNSYSN